MDTLNILTAIFAFVAAILWFLSAKIKTPNSFSIHVVKPDEMPLGGNPMGGTYQGHAYSSDLIKLAESLSQQSKLSAWAAIFAGLSAIIQTISILLNKGF